MYGRIPCSLLNRVIDLCVCGSSRFVWCMFSSYTRKCQKSKEHSPTGSLRWIFRRLFSEWILHEDLNYHLYKIYIIDTEMIRLKWHVSCFFEILINEVDVLNLLTLSDEAHFQFCGYVFKLNVLCCTEEFPLQLHEHSLQFFQALAHEFLASTFLFSLHSRPFKKCFIGKYTLIQRLVFCDYWDT
jgi:hypothetical protein